MYFVLKLEGLEKLAARTLTLIDSKVPRQLVEFYSDPLSVLHQVYSEQDSLSSLSLNN